jgi:hypothetical protein
VKEIHNNAGFGLSDSTASTVAAFIQITDQKSLTRSTGKKSG